MGQKVTITPVFSCSKVVVKHVHKKRKSYNPYYTRDKIEGFICLLYQNLQN